MRIICLVIISTMLLASCANEVLLVPSVTEAGLILSEERSIGENIGDKNIWINIRQKMLHTDINNLFHAINVKVIEGRILLTGSVPDPKYRMQAVEISWQTSGVIEVINEIQISNKERSLQDIATYSKDSWITTRIRSKTLVDSKVKSVNYSIDTIGGIVYVMGIAQDEEEIQYLNDLISKIKGVTKVMNYARIKDSTLRRINYESPYHNIKQN